MNTPKKQPLLSSSIYSNCLDHYNDVRDLDFVVNDAIPIPFFGDIEKYLSSPVRIVTAALNPSDVEFLEKNKRFDVDQARHDPFSLETELSNYFKKSPYKKWFSSFEPVLNGLCASYGGKMKIGEFKSTALHLDMCSPIATKPTWSKLSAKQRKLLMPKGQEVFKQLLIALKPNIVISSLGWGHISGWDKAFSDGKNWPTFISHDKKENGEAYKRKPKIQVKDIIEFGEHPFIFAMASAGFTPFFGFTTSRKYEAGEKLFSEIEIRRN